MTLQLGKLGEIYLNDPNFDAKLKAIRAQVSLMNAKRKAAGDREVMSGNFRVTKSYRLELYYRLGRNNPNNKFYKHRYGHGVFRIKKEHAERVAIYIRNAYVWKPV